MTQLNKHGIPVRSNGHKRKKQPLTESLETRRFRLLHETADVEVVLPLFSPIIQVCLQDGWREIK